MTEQRKLHQREYRVRINNSVSKRYEKTEKGFLVRTYRNMKSRVEGVQKLKSHLYKGLELLEKDIFYDFSLNDNNFKYLYDIWIKNNYNRKLTPSIDRIDSTLGYNLNNIRWITHSENSRLGVISRNKKYKNENMAY